jgi:hypothetical protein
VRADLSVATDHERYAIWVFADPLFKTPLVLGTNMPAAPEAIFGLYLDRWPVEQIPLVPKQLLGCQRQFVFTPTSCWRLGELAAPNLEHRLLNDQRDSSDKVISAVAMWPVLLLESVNLPTSLTLVGQLKPPGRPSVCIITHPEPPYWRPQAR